MKTSAPGRWQYEPRPVIQIRMPVGGWQVGFRPRPNGRTAIEVTDPAGSLARLVTSTRLPTLSIEAGWAGRARDYSGGTHWWALAIGHVPADAGRPTATFICGTHQAPGNKAALSLHAVDGLWMVYDGMWVAAVIGHYTHIQLTARSETRLLRLHSA